MSRNGCGKCNIRLEPDGDMNSIDGTSAISICHMLATHSRSSTHKLTVKDGVILCDGAIVICTAEASVGAWIKNTEYCRHILDLWIAENKDRPDNDGIEKVKHCLVELEDSKDIMAVRKSLLRSCY
jgi:hypothetical protein